MKWQQIEPRLYKLYYNLPLLSYSQKRRLILFAHRHLSFFTRGTESFRHFNHQQKGGLVLTPDEQALSFQSSFDYPEWLKRYATINERKRREMKKALTRFSKRPLISVIMPVYNTEERWLRAAIDSVREQIYPHWELCIADDASTLTHVRKVLEEYMAKDARIKVVFRTRNGHISAASNSALKLAGGEFVALLDHDDALDESALFRVAESINLFPDAGILYSDEDKITDDGTRKDPYFKSDWNPDLFLSHNMVSHLGVYRRELVSRIGGFRKGYEGSQDHDLALRVSELLQPDQIVHIPYVLYHWRVISGSTALAGSEKNYAIKAATRAINDALTRRGIAARATESELVTGTVRVRYALPAPIPMVSLIIPSRNGLKLLRTCIGSIVEKTRYPNYEIIVVDNGSDDPATLDYLGTMTECAPVPFRVIRDERPFNFSQLNNMAVGQARGDVIGLINNDIEVINADWLQEMVSHACRPEVGAVGARLLYSDGRLQHAGIVIGIGGVAGHFMKYLPPGGIDYFSKTRLIQNYSAVTAACLVTRKSVYRDIGGLDETHLPVAFNDVDLCLRLCKAGYRIVYTPFAELYHHESATRGAEYETLEKAARAIREIEYMKARWDTENFNDPAYNPNLSIYHENCSYSFPPRL